MKNGNTSRAYRQTTSSQVNGQIAHQAVKERPVAAPTRPSVFQMMRAVRRKESGLEPVQRVVLLEILDRADNPSGMCRWSNQEIADFLGLDARRMRRIIAQLVDMGYVENVRHGVSVHAYKSMRIGQQLLDLAREHGKLGHRAPGHPDPTSRAVHPDIQTLPIAQTKAAMHPDISRTAPGHTDPTGRTPRPYSMSSYGAEEEKPDSFSSSASDRPPVRSGLPDERSLALNSDKTPPPEPTAPPPPSDDDSVDDPPPRELYPDEWLQSVLGEQRARETAARIEREQRGRTKLIELRMREERAKAKQAELLETIHKHAAEHPEAKP